MSYFMVNIYSVIPRNHATVKSEQCLFSEVLHALAEWRTPYAPVHVSLPVVYFLRGQATCMILVSLSHNDFGSYWCKNVLRRKERLWNVSVCSFLDSVHSFPSFLGNHLLSLFRSFLYFPSSPLCLPFFIHLFILLHQSLSSSFLYLLLTFLAHTLL